MLTMLGAHAGRYRMAGCPEFTPNLLSRIYCEFTVEFTVPNLLNAGHLKLPVEQIDQRACR